MRQSVGTVRSLEVAGVSAESWGEAANTALEQLRASIARLAQDEAVGACIRAQNGQVAGFRVDLTLALVLEHGSRD
jgi:flavin-binding protein dodecin